jgi:hypothetical protein
MGPTEQYGGIIPCVRWIVADLVDWLDEYGDADPDLEEPGDLEPSLGWQDRICSLCPSAGDDRERRR